MAFWEEDFESYSPGALPSTDWLFIPGTSANVINTDHYPAVAGGTQALDLRGRIRRQDETSPHSQFTLYFATKMVSRNDVNPNAVIELSTINPDYLDPNTHYFPLITIFVASDNTISIQGHGAFLGNSAPYTITYDQWVFYQLSVKLGSSVGFITAQADLWQDGINIVSAAPTLLDVLESATWDGAADINRFIFANFGGTAGIFDCLTLDTYTASSVYPHPGATIKSRVNQMVVEAGRKPTAKSRVTQMVVEPGRKPSTAKSRIIQMVIELPVKATARRRRVYEA